MTPNDVAKSLAEKLAGASLSDDETNLLVSLIQDDAEVEGFKASPKIARGFNLGMPPIIDQNKPDRWIDVLSTDWG